MGTSPLIVTINGRDVFHLHSAKLLNPSVFLMPSVESIGFTLTYMLVTRCTWLSS